MKISDIYNLPRQSSYDVEEVFRLKDWGRSIFPIQNTIGVNWAVLKKNVPGWRPLKFMYSIIKV